MPCLFLGNNAIVILRWSRRIISRATVPTGLGGFILGTSVEVAVGIVSGGKEGLDFCLEFMRLYDTDLLRQVRLSEAAGLTGVCYLPSEENGGTFSILCRVGSVCPMSILLAEKPLHFSYEVDSWSDIESRLPEGCVIIRARRKRRGLKEGWMTVKRQVQVNSMSEALVFIFGHEFYHFLRATGQVPGRNDEQHADRFGWELLTNFRARRVGRLWRKRREFQVATCLC